jgi:hypothetical protein
MECIIEGKGKGGEYATPRRSSLLGTMDRPNITRRLGFFSLAAEIERSTVRALHKVLWLHERDRIQDDKLESHKRDSLRRDPTSRQAATAHVAQADPQRRSSRRAVAENSDAWANFPALMRTRCLRGPASTGRLCARYNEAAPLIPCCFHHICLASMSARPPSGLFRATIFFRS